MGTCSSLRRRMMMGGGEVTLPNYLCFTALEDGTFSFTIQSGVTTGKVSYISYSVDNGATWVKTNNVASTEVVITTPTIQAGNKVYWKGFGTAMSYGINANQQTVVSSTGKFDISGDILSLLYDNNFVNYNVTKNQNYTFYRLFKGTQVVDASAMIFPHDAGKTSQYGGMFQNCTELISAPSEIPATTQSVTSCFDYTFDGCTKLVNAPVIKTKNIGGRGMFRNCISLVSVAQIALDASGVNLREFFRGCTSLKKNPFVMTANAGFTTNNGASDCFRDCTSLTDAGTIRAGRVASNCFGYMFSGCTSLIVAPTIDTPLAENIYNNMFYGCTSLITPPILPATTLIKDCYKNMFYNCTSLKAAPELPATTLIQSCYNQMFRRSGVTWIKMLATDISASECLTNWMYDVGNTSNSVFIKHIDATWTTTGNSGVPTNWTVIYYDPSEDKYYTSQDKSQECDDHGNPI